MIKTKPFNPRQCGKIFISYRRDNGAELARLVYEKLRLRGCDVFMDVEDLRSGQFNTALYNQIEASTNVVIILTPNSLERCSNNGDWLRLEVAHAIKCQKNVIPVLARNFKWPAQSLPEDIAKLPSFQGIESSHDYFEASIDRLARLFVPGPREPLPRRAGFTAATVSIAVLLVVAGIFFISQIPSQKRDTVHTAQSAINTNGQPGNLIKRKIDENGSVDYANSNLSAIKQVVSLYSNSELLLIKILKLQDNNIQKIESLEKLPNLVVLNLKNNRISKMENLENNTFLHGISIENNTIQKIEGLEKNGRLMTLNLGANQITEIEGLDNLKYLENLALYGNNIYRIHNLSGLISLKNLELFNNKIETIENLDYLKNLEGLALSRNNISKIEKIDGLIKLKILGLDDNQIIKIEGLEKLANLEILGLSKNKINKIEGLDNLVKVQYISLSDNLITKLANLEGLEKLTKIDLKGNRIIERDKRTVDFLANKKLL